MVVNTAVAKESRREPEGGRRTAERGGAVHAKHAKTCRLVWKAVRDEETWHGCVGQRVAVVRLRLQIGSVGGRGTG